MERIDGDYQVAVSFAAVQALLADAKIALLAGSVVGAMEKVAVGVVLLNRTLGDLETVTNVPWTAIAVDPNFGKA